MTAILNRITLALSALRAPKAAAEVAARWSEAAFREPELAGDVIRMGGVLSKQPAEYKAGVERLTPLCPYRLARNEGRRELAVEILALMHITPDEIRRLMEDESNAHP